MLTDKVLPWPFDPGRSGMSLARSLGLGLLAALAAAALAVIFRAPSHDRDWRAEIAVLPAADRAGERLDIDQVRDWTYSADGPLATAYHPGTYDMAGIARVWLMVEPFGGSDAIAHTLVLFEFANGRFLALTIEARKEEGETYSALRGAFNTYELLYLWAEARDVLVRRARYLKHGVYLYPLDLPEAERRAFLGALADKTAALKARPRFYNTLFSNCTNELAKTAGLAWDPAFILTGFAPRHLWQTGMIPGRAAGQDFESVRAQADMAGAIDALPDESPAVFDRALLDLLDRRFPADP